MTAEAGCQAGKSNSSFSSKVQPFCFGEVGSDQCVNDITPHRFELLLPPFLARGHSFADGFDFSTVIVFM